MPQTYKPRRLRMNTNVPYQHNIINFKLRQNCLRNEHQYGNSNSSHRFDQLGHQSQEQLTTIPLPNGPLFKRSMLIPCWINARAIGPGLVNSQNNCFLNSVLECLTYTPSLAQYFLYHGHRHQCTSNRFCAMCAMDHHVHRCLVEPKSFIRGASILPRAFTSNLQAFSKTLRLGNQEDAHEFMMFLLDSMHKSTVQCYGKLDAKVERTAFIYQIFGGQLRSQLRCRSCDAKSDTFDNFLDLSVDLQQANSVHSALENFIKVDMIGGNDPDSKYQCESCEQKVNAEKQMTLYELPSYLCIHLKRFTFDMDRGYMHKLTKDIHYEENLDMAPYVSEEADCPSTTYQLYAVLVHLGYGCDRGHYFTYVKAPDGEWYRMDDEAVTPVPVGEVLSQQAYMLFYTTDKYDTQNKSTEVVILREHTTNDEIEIGSEHISMGLLSVVSAATAAAAQEAGPDEKTVKVAEMSGREKGRTAIDGQQQPVASIVENPSEEEIPDYNTDGCSTWTIGSSSKPTRSLRGNMSPPTFTAAVSDPSIWTIEDREMSDKPNGSLGDIWIRRLQGWHVESSSDEQDKMAPFSSDVDIRTITQD